LNEILSGLENNFYRVIESTISPENTRNALDKLSECELVNFALGLHPYHAGEFGKQILKEYTKAIDDTKKIVAIGEVSLDLKSKISIDKQKDVFLEFIDLAKQFDLPLLIHNRGFKETILKLIKEKNIKKVIFHCFSQDRDFLEQLSKGGYFISFAGNITFKNASAIQEAAKVCPLENILSETDSPYLAPQVIRGKRNNPLYVKEVVNKIAIIKNKSTRQIEDTILKNAKNVFKI